MNAARIAGAELRRMTNGLLPKLAVLALTLVPLLYGATYLYANWDPYKHLGSIQAALVVEDEGASIEAPAADGKKRTTHLTAGNDVAADLEKSGSFDWVRTSPEDAADGVRSGRYGFSLTIPKDFSANLASPQNFDAAKQALFTVTTNDANNYVLSTIVGRLTGSIHNAVATQVGEKTANQLLGGYSSIHSSMIKAADGADKLTQGGRDAQKGAADLAAGLGTLTDGARSLASGEGQLVTGADQLAGGAGKLSQGADTLSTGASSLATGANSLNTGASNLATGANSLATGLDTMNQKVTALPGQAQKLAAGAKQVADGNAVLNASVQDAVAALDTLGTTADQAAAERLATLVKDGTLTQEQADAITQRVLAAQASTTVTQARARVADAAAKVNQLATGSQAVSEGASALAQGAGQLSAATGQAATGAHSLAEGAGKLSQGAGSLSTGAGSLASGAAELSKSTTTLAAGASNLAANQRTAANGAASLRDGLVSAQNGASSLGSGLKKLTDGTSTLASQIRAGADQVPNPSETVKERASKVIADPVKVTDSAQTTAQSYGAGLAPFFLSLSLWIGVFILTQLMRPLTPRALASNAPSLAVSLGGWLPFLLIGLAQALVLFTAVTLGVGLTPVHPWLLLGTMLLGTFSFSAVIHGIVALLGSPGKLVVLVLMILQLVSSGGTFPWQTTPEPLHSLHRYLPMGYMVDAMRQITYGGDLGIAREKLLVLAAWGVFGLLLGALATMRSRRWTLSTFKPVLTP